MDAKTARFVEGKTTLHWAWIVLATCFVNLFINYSVRLGYGVVLPEMIRTLGFGRTAGGSIYNSYFLSYIALTPLTGYLTDRLGARPVITCCCLILGIGVFLMGTVTALWTACLFYALVGLGASGMWTPVITVVQRWFSPHRRGLALGILSTGYGLGFATMGAAFPLIVHYFTWRHTWYFLGIGAMGMVIVNGLLLKSEPEASMNYYGMSDSIYDGKLLSYGYSGELIAYDIPTGDVLWTYIACQEGYESPYGNYPIGVACIADGKVYLTSSEHSPTQPLWRGSRIRCVDVSNGEELWTINHWGMGMGAGSGVVIADGYIVGLNAYDNQIYCYGKGPSATEVTAAPKIVEKGSSVMIEGTVTDQSSGAKSREVMAKSPNEEGIPCISDEYMTEWMEYLYMDQGIPGDATGVEVTLDAIDPNGNFVHIDTVRSDMSGMFKKKWTPEHEVEYTIIATFEGSKSYWASYAETTVGVDPAPAPSGPIEPEPTEPTEAPLITTEVAILLAAVIVAIAVIAGFWILRKRK